MTQEFNLSEKILEHKKMGELMSLLPDDVLFTKDVKEFIRLLKEEVKDNFEVTIHDFDIMIDKLAGSKLIEVAK